MTSKRQQTFAKMTRERKVKEKRERKAEKKAAAIAERARLAEEGLEATIEGDETPIEGAADETPADLAHSD
jgi:hypothetical protein